MEANWEDFLDLPDSSQTGGRTDGFGPASGQRQPEPKVVYQQAPRYAPQQEEYQEEEQLPDEVTQQLSEAETRLYKAQIYNQYLASPPFEATDDLTREVADEFAAFARYKLEKLLGVGTAASFESPFSDFEVQILRAVVRKVAQQTGAKEPPAQKKEPPARTQAPVMGAVPAPVPPAPPRTQQRPAQKPVQAAQAQRKPQTTAPARKPQPAPQKQPQKAEILQDGQLLMDPSGTKVTHKVKWIQMYNFDEYGTVVGERLKNMKPGSTLTLPNGMQVVMTEGMELFKVLKQDVALQARAPTSLPFPTIQMMEHMTAAQSSEAVSKLPRLAQAVGNAMKEE